MNKPIKLVIVTIFALTILAACAPVEPELVVQSTAASDEPQAAAIDGRTLLEERCTTCHTMDNITTESGTFEEWEAIVDRMIQRGANLSDEEKAILVQYLADNYKD